MATSADGGPRLVPARASSTLGLADGHYHYQLCGLQHPESSPSSGSLAAVTGPVAVISSDDRLRLVDLRDLDAGLSDIEAATRELGSHQNVTGLQPLPGAAGPGLMTAGRDGLVRHWDARVGRQTWVREHKSQAPYLSLASCSNDYLWAAGTELVSSVAIVEVWDTRSMSEPIASYTECHSDDVSNLSFSPISSTLLSGSTDGLVNVYSPTFPTDEDDALLQVINHGSSIHHAGFLNKDNLLYALSHDETLSIYRREDSKDDSVDDTEMEDVERGDNGCLKALGDVRRKFSCGYVADIIPNEAGIAVAAGSHSLKRMDILNVPLAALVGDEQPLGKLERVSLAGAHGEEIVRSILPYRSGAQSLWITAGEDGKVCFWPMSNIGVGEEGAEEGMDEEDRNRVGGMGERSDTQISESKRQKKRRRSEKGERDTKHFRPY